MSYRRNNYGFGGYNFGSSLGKSLFRSNRHNRKSKNSPESGCLLLILLLGLAIYTKNQQMISLFTLLIVLGLVAFIIYQLYKVVQHEKLARTGIFDIDEMEGTEFENRLKIMFENLGYKVEHTGKSGDAGVDLILWKYGQKTAVQAKRYQGNVGVSAVQEVHTGMDYYDCDKAIIVTNSRFTDEAWRVAKKTHIKLWNRNYLIKVLQTEKEHIHPPEEETVTPEKPETTTAEESSIKQQATVPQEQVLDPRLVEFITVQLSQGHPWTEIKALLVEKGWKSDVVDNAFFHVFNSQASSQTITDV